MYGIREIGSGLWWDGEGWGNALSCKCFPSIMAALAEDCGRTITEVVRL